MKRMAIWGGAGAVIIALLALAAFFYPHSAAAPKPGESGAVACTMDAKICPDGSAVGRSGPNCEFAACPTPSFSWTFADKGEDQHGAPQTAVSLAMNGKSFDLGTYAGNCTDVKGSSWKPVEGEQAGVICYFAGGGVELGVFEENGKLVVKKGIVDEGTAETASTRGGFDFLLSLVP